MKVYDVLGNELAVDDKCFHRTLGGVVRIISIEEAGKLTGKPAFLSLELRVPLIKDPRQPDRPDFLINELMSVKTPPESEVVNPPSSEEVGRVKGAMDRALSAVRNRHAGR